jgi:tRNA (mo5U34)-methyltransferase
MAKHIEFVESVGIDTLLGKQRALIYPAASGADYFLRFLRAQHPAFLAKITGLADRDPHKQGLSQHGLKVFAPAELKDLGLDVVVITSCEHFQAMRAELAALLGPGVEFLLADTIREYWQDAARLSKLAARAEALPPLDAASGPQQDLGSFFLGMPLGPGQYTRSTKGILTYQFLDQIRLPQDLTGKRVLDLAASDGFYSFECEARGAAEVISVEGPQWKDGDGFKRYDFAHKRYNSKVKHMAAYLEDLDAEALGPFDLSLCLGLYYHLRDPFFCLRKLCTMTREMLIVTGRTIRYAPFDPIHPGQPASVMMLSDKSFGKWTANTHALIDMLKIAGFPRVEVLFDFCPEGSLIASTAIAAYK